LTEREVEVLRLIAKGRTNRQIAELLFITENTVANHVKNVLSKTQTANRTGAAAYAVDKSLV
jgi:DNA-binding NarL/FixJ family response regulator